jgi:hypothetical protein
MKNFGWYRGGVSFYATIAHCSYVWWIRWPTSWRALVHIDIRALTMPNIKEYHIIVFGLGCGVGVLRKRAPLIYQQLDETSMQAHETE